MAVYAITEITTKHRRYLAVQHSWNTELFVTDLGTGKLIYHEPSIDLPVGVKVGEGFTIDVFGGGRPFDISSKAVSVTEMHLDPTQPIPPTAAMMLERTH